MTKTTIFSGVFRLLVHLGWRGPAAVMLLHVPYTLIVLFVLPEWGEDSSGLWHRLFEAVWHGSIGIVGDMALVLMTVDLVEDQAPRFWLALRRAAAHLPALFVATMFLQVGMVVGMAFLIAPGMWVLTTFALTGAIIVVEKQSIRGSLRRSADRMRGHRTTLLLAIVVLGLAAYGLRLLLIEVEVLIYDALWAASDDGYGLAGYIVSFVWMALLRPLVTVPRRLVAAVVYVKLVSVRDEANTVGLDVDGASVDA